MHGYHGRSGGRARVSQTAGPELKAMQPDDPLYGAKFTVLGGYVAAVVEKLKTFILKALADERGKLIGVVSLRV